METIKAQNTDPAQKMRDICNRYTPQGLHLILLGVIRKRMKYTEKASILAIGMTILNKSDPVLCKDLHQEIAADKMAAKILKEMERIATVTVA